MDILGGFFINRLEPNPRRTRSKVTVLVSFSHATAGGNCKVGAHPGKRLGCLRTWLDTIAVVVLCFTVCGLTVRPSMVPLGKAELTRFPV